MQKVHELAINGGLPVGRAQDLAFNWPRITKESERAVLAQLHKSISIYNKSGIIADFEQEFSAYHDKKFGLLSNSGTSAIFSMFEAINLQPGDEVLCPVYTFHATVSPLMYIGAVPIFCDSDDQGNISLEAIEQKITPKTKAVIVTHMWGVPVKDIEKITSFCKKRNLWLLEDCSHAHGASIYSKKVGAFGDAAAWSLQGQKIITGGEGGIMLTNSSELYSRALLQGHYNKRPKQEISDSSKLKKYALTGLGLKLRAHPLATALALQQFGHLDDFIKQKQKYALLLNKHLQGISFLKAPKITQNSQNSWYAYNLLYDSNKAYGVSREEFVSALHAEGLIEADIPGSTCLLNQLPLFNTPNEILSRLYPNPLHKQKDFPKASQFYDSVIKFPVWAFADELHIVNAYIKGIKKVAQYLTRHHSLRPNAR